MSVALQVRDVPEVVRDRLAAAAEQQGRSLQALLLELVKREALLLDNATAFERTASARVEIPHHLGPADIIREGRDYGFTSDRHH